MDVPLLLAAVSATSPCGEDMEYDAQFLQLERDAKGQPERSMGDSILPAEPPDWRSIQQQSLDLLQRSKDLRITHFLLQSALALQGVAGLADALTLINALLRESILTRSRTFGPVSLRAALNASGLMSFPDEQLGAQQLNAAFLDSDPEQLQATRDALSTARAACEAIEQQVSDQVGSAQGVDLSLLKQPLKQALQILSQFVPSSETDSREPEAVSDDNAPSVDFAAAPVAPRPSGDIANRDDVLRSLDKILAYYSRYEPSSPLPVLLNRAKHLVHADFAAIVRNLIPDGMSQFENLRGPDGE